MDKLAELPVAGQPAVVEPVLLNTLNVQTTFMPSADVLPLNPDDDDLGPGYQNRECRVKRIQVNTSAFTSDLYPEPVFVYEVFEDPVFAGDDTPIYDAPTKINFFDVGTMHDYWSRDLHLS